MTYYEAMKAGKLFYRILLPEFGLRSGGPIPWWGRLSLNFRRCVRGEPSPQWDARGGRSGITNPSWPDGSSSALEAGLWAGQLYSSVFDEFEVEPTPTESYLGKDQRCVFGSHNASNTADAVARTSEIEIGSLAGFFAETGCRNG